MIPEVLGVDNDWIKRRDSDTGYLDRHCQTAEYRVNPTYAPRGSLSIRCHKQLFLQETLLPTELCNSIVS